jgi:CHAD domain-containing protein
VSKTSAYNHQVRKRSEKIYGLVHDPVRIYTPAYFHRLRVEIKKMNAVLRLVKFCSPDFPRKRILKPYKELGKSAGEVREIQLEEAIIRKLPPGPFTHQYLSVLKEMHGNKKKHFIEIKTKVHSELHNRELKIIPYVDEINSINIQGYFSEITRNCVAQMDGNRLKTSLIHKLRMLLKEFFYNIEVIQPDAKTSLKKINLLQDLIGKWHDYSVIITHLDNFKRRNKFNQRDSSRLQKTRIDLSARSSLLLSRINKVKDEALTELHQLKLTGDN